jgi:hypothetical protein
MKAPSKRITPMVDHMVRETDKLTFDDCERAPAMNFRAPLQSTGRTTRGAKISHATEHQQWPELFLVVLFAALGA